MQEIAVKAIEQLQAGKEGQDISEQSRRAIQEGKIPDPREGQMPDKHQQEISRALLPEDYQKELDVGLSDKSEDWTKKLLPDEGDSVKDVQQDAVRDELSVRDTSEKLAEDKISEVSFDEGKILDDKCKEIYEAANVDVDNPRVENLKGKEITVYPLKDIDPQFMAPDGKSNIEKMEKGEAPYVLRDGKPERVELHHHGQNNDAPLIELDEKTHGNNDEFLHPNRGKGEGRGDDPDWNSTRKQYWINRADDFVS